MEGFKEIYNICSQYLNIILIIFSAIVSLIAVYNKIKSNFTGLISSFIKLAEEDTSLSNIEKMDMVVQWIKQLIPNIFKIVFNDKTLRQIAQNIYDDMKQYKNIYIKNKTGLTTSQVISTINELKDDPESPIQEKLEKNNSGV